MGKKKNKKIDLGADSAGFGHNPFAAALSSTTAPEASAEVKANLSKKERTDASPWDLSFSSKLVLRCDAKRRRGRIVTLIEGIEGGSKSELKQLARTLGKRLGTGASVDSETVILIQGDHRERLPEILTAHGANKIQTLDFR